MLLHDRRARCDNVVPHMWEMTQGVPKCWLVSALSCGQWCALRACMHSSHPPLLHKKLCEQPPYRSSTNLCTRSFSMARMAHPPYTPAAALKLLIDGQKVCCGRPCPHC